MPAPLRPPKLVNLRVSGPGLLDRRGRFFVSRYTHAQLYEDHQRVPKFWRVRFGVLDLLQEAFASLLPATDEQTNRDRKGNGGGGDTGDDDPLILGLFQKLPEPEADWPASARLKWLQTAATSLILSTKSFRQRSRQRAIKIWRIGLRFSHAVLNVVQTPRRHNVVPIETTCQTERGRRLRRPYLPSSLTIAVRCSSWCARAVQLREMPKKHSGSAA